METVAAPGAGGIRPHALSRQGFGDQGPEALVRQSRLPGRPQDDEGAGYGPTGPEAIDGREKFAPHQVAGGAQHHQQVRINVVVAHSGHKRS